MMNRSLPRLCLSLLIAAPIVAAVPGGNLVLAILGISFLIAVHEWGHFMACRLTGTRTETFSIGFGPRLFGWEKTKDGERRFTVGRRQLDPAAHAMDFRIASIPLGGYVKMAGEIPGEGGAAGGKPAPDEFPGKSAWARIFIVCAGVIMNFFTAAVFYFFTYQFHKSYNPPIVGVVSPGEGAWHAGVKPGDRVLSLDGVRIDTWIDLRMEIAFASPDEDSTLIVERDGKRLSLAVRPVYHEETGILRFGVGGAGGLELGSGGTVFSIGPQDRLTVAGVPVVGGVEAGLVLRAGLKSGESPLRAERKDGSSYELTADPAVEESDAGPAPGAKLGVSPFIEPVVTAVRGPAAGVFREGDVLLGVWVDGEPKAVPVNSAAGLESLIFRDSLQAFQLRREDKVMRADFALTDRVALNRFFDDVSFDAEPTNRVVPYAAGDFSGPRLYRYPGSPIAKVGIPAGARLLRVGTWITRNWNDIMSAVKKAEVGKPLNVTYQVGSKPAVEVAVTPVALVYVGTVSMTDVEHKERWDPDGVAEALGLGAARTWRETKNVFRTIGALFTGNISFNKNIAGPITLVTASKRFADDSFLRLIWFLAYVSVMLAVLNILPIPVLDGGHLMFIIIEKIKGSPLKDETIFRFQKIGFLLLLVLMFFAFKNDFTRLFS